MFLTGKYRDTEFPYLGPYAEKLAKAFVNLRINRIDCDKIDSDCDKSVLSRYVYLYYAENIADAIILLYNKSILTQENFDAVTQNPQYAKNVAVALVSLQNMGILTKKTRRLVQHNLANKAEIVGYILDEIKKIFNPHDLGIITSDLISKCFDWLLYSGKVEFMEATFEYCLKLLRLYGPDNTDNPLYLFLTTLNVAFKYYWDRAANYVTYENYGYSMSKFRDYEIKLLKRISWNLPVPEMGKPLQQETQQQDSDLGSTATTVSPAIQAPHASLFGPAQVVDTANISTEQLLYNCALFSGHDVSSEALSTKGLSASDVPLITPGCIMHGCIREPQEQGYVHNVM